MKAPGLDETLDMLIVGIGPPALVALKTAKDAGLRAIGVDKGPLCGALVRHPAYMRWFSTTDKLELCGFPLLTNEKNPSRREYLKYCRSFVKHFDLDVASYREVTQVARRGDLFDVEGRDVHGRTCTWTTRNVVVGTGFYDNPRPLDVPGEDLPHVSHQFSEVHYYSDHEVVIIGGGSSAAEAALELWREGTRVTILMRSDRFHTKYWVEPDVENRIKEGSIGCHRNVEIREIRPDEVVFTDESGGEQSVSCDFVLAMTGYQPDTTLLKSIGAEVDSETLKPVLTENLETTVPGLFVMGTLIAGVDSNVVFIENSRQHGPAIVSGIIAHQDKTCDRVDVQLDESEV